MDAIFTIKKLLYEKKFTIDGAKRYLSTQNTLFGEIKEELMEIVKYSIKETGHENNTGYCSFPVRGGRMQRTGPYSKDGFGGHKDDNEDPRLSELSQQAPGCRNKYTNCTRLRGSISIRMARLYVGSGPGGQKYYYPLVQVRPRNIMFGEVQTKPQERFAEVYERHFEKNLRLMKVGDLKDGVDGLAFGVYWPVRDLSQCDSHGGFLEYTLIYFSKADFIDLAAKNISLNEAVENAEVVTSLGRKPAKNIKINEVE